MIWFHTLWLSSLARYRNFRLTHVPSKAPGSYLFSTFHYDVSLCPCRVRQAPVQTTATWWSSILEAAPSMCLCSLWMAVCLKWKLLAVTLTWAERTSTMPSWTTLSPRWVLTYPFRSISFSGHAWCLLVFIRTPCSLCARASFADVACVLCEHVATTQSFAGYARQIIVKSPD